jgi:hypothetical protein
MFGRRRVRPLRCSRADRHEPGAVRRAISGVLERRHHGQCGLCAWFVLRLRGVSMRVASGKNGGGARLAVPQSRTVLGDTPARETTHSLRTR